MPELNAAATYALSDEFKKYCLALRLGFQTASEPDYDPLTLSGACHDAALVLTRHLNRKGEKANFIEGYYDGHSHCWTRFKVRRSMYIVDITVTQFGDHLPPVLIVREGSRHPYDANSIDSKHYLQSGALSRSQVNEVLRRTRRLLRT